MKSHSFGTQVPRRLLTSLFGVAACIAVTALPAFADENPAGATAKAAAAPAAAGMVIYVDPKTGALLSEPAPGTQPLQLTPQEQNALSTSDEGMKPVPNSVPGGGLKIDFKGRYQSPLIATVDENGKVMKQHPGESPASHDHK